MNDGEVKVLAMRPNDRHKSYFIGIPQSYMYDDPDHESS
jgi:hypothetical protein